MTATVPVQRNLKQRLKQVCTNLKEFRISQGISASFLAKKASITRVTLNKLEQGDLGVSVGVWLKVLSVLSSSDKSVDLSKSLTQSSSSSKKQTLSTKKTGSQRSPKTQKISKPVSSKTKLSSSSRERSRSRSKIATRSSKRK